MALTKDDRFWKRVRRGGLNECWPWLGKVAANGYGMVDLTRRPVRRATTAHRAVYERLVGPVPPGLDLDHLCRNRWCVNPRHLEPVTRVENLRRGKESLGLLLPEQCKNGHTYTPETTREAGGKRSCRPCEAARTRKHRAKGGRQ